jgi:hypothetical protein
MSAQAKAFAGLEVGRNHVRGFGPVAAGDLPQGTILVNRARGRYYELLDRPEEWAADEFDDGHVEATFQEMLKPPAEVAAAY